MFALLKETWISFRGHDGPLLSGAVAFYMLLATAPIGVIAVAIAGAVLGEEAAAGELIGPLEKVLGEEAAFFVSEIVERASEPGGSRLATTLGAIFLVLAVMRLFMVLHSALNHVWGVRTRAKLGFRGKAWRVLQKRLLSFGMSAILGASVLLFVLLKTGLSAAENAFGHDVPLLFRVLEFLLSVVVGTLLTALVFKVLPDVRISWRDVFIGAFVTTLFSAVGALLIGTYLGRASIATSYGAAGAMVLLLLWVYYTAQIFFLGAEFTGAWARRMGRGVIPLAHAVELRTLEERLTIEPPTRLSLYPADTTADTTAPGRSSQDLPSR